MVSFKENKIVDGWLSEVWQKSVIG